MAADPGESKVVHNSRRSFLAKMGMGLAAVTALSTGVVKLGKRPDQAQARAGEFPGPDSIFHPASDPRLDPRRKQ